MDRFLRKFILSSMLCLMTAVLLLPAGFPTASAQSPANNSPVPVPTPDTFKINNNLTATAQAPKNAKLDSVLAQLAAANLSASAVTDLAEQQLLRVVEDRVQVQIVTGAISLNQVRAIAAHVGGEVTGTAFDDTIVQAWLPINALETVAADPAVRFIRRPPLAQPLGNLQIGQATTEALEVINAPAWHAAGYNGSGVKIAIIDGGFRGYPGLLGSDLPASLTVKNFVDGETEVQVDGATEHGTACAEIIHDLAPGAQLYLVKIATDVDLAEAVAWLIDQKVDLISSSFGFYNVAPGDGAGPLADLVSQARQAGILWVTAAGNDRESHWGGVYVDSDGNGLHEFGDNQEVNCFTSSFEGEDCSTIGFLVTVGLLERINIFLRWNDWAAVDQDYDLHLVRLKNGVWEKVPNGSSANPQTGLPGQTPTEWINFGLDLNGDIGDLFTQYGLIIERVNGNRPVNFELFIPGAGGLLKTKIFLTARSLANLADAPQAITVAALNVQPPYAQEFYSSEGPTNGPGGTAEGGFIKPDLAGFANVSTVSYGAGLFNGTSSATPHVTGAAALVLSAHPTYNPAQLQAFLQGRATDMGEPGRDSQFGYGRLYLGSPAPGVNTPPILTKLPDQRLEPGGSLNPALDLWIYAGDAEDSVEALQFSLSSTPPSAGVTLATNRYININPGLDWPGLATVTVQVRDTGSLTTSNTFAVRATEPGATHTTLIYLPAILK